MGYWKDLLPALKKTFITKASAAKKAAAAEIIKAFDDAKEGYTKEFDEKKTELEPKIVEVLEATPAPVKALIKEPKDSGIKKNSAEIVKVLDKLAEIGFPGAKPVAEAATKFGTSYVPGPIKEIFVQIAQYLPAEPVPEAAAPATEEASTVAVTDKEIVPEVAAPAATEEKKEEETPAPAPAVAATAEPVTTPAPDAAPVAPVTVEAEKPAEPAVAPPAQPAPAAASTAPAAAAAVAEPPKP